MAYSGLSSLCALFSYDKEVVMQFSLKFFLVCLLHIGCWIAEIVLWMLPHNMPVPQFIALVACIWLVSLILICRDVRAWWIWSQTPYPEPAMLVAQLSEEDERRRKSEWQQMCVRQEDAA